MIKTACILLALLLSACAPMRNLDLADVRTDANLRQTGVLQMTMQEARACALATNYCKPSGGAGVVDEPAGNGFSLMIYGVGLTQMNPYMVIDFRDENGMAAYRGYTAMSSWSDAVADQIKRVEACGECSGL